MSDRAPGDTFLDQAGQFVRVLPDGRWGTIEPLLFGQARICVGQAGSLHFDDVW